MDLINLHSQGQAFCSPLDLTAAGTFELVEPKPQRVDLATPSAGDGFRERWQVVVLGFAWAFVAAASGDGFTMEGASSLATDELWKVLASAAGPLNGSVTPCYLPLQPAGADSPDSDPALLRVVVVAGITSGKLLVWGVHTPAQGREALYQGSPQWKYV